MTERILFVDDESRILEGYRRTLRKSFTVVTAASGTEALDLMTTEGPFPVIVSDMQMPEMNGVQLLAEVKDRYPDTIRLMLTGNADQETAVEAINKGDVFRFLNKPCSSEEMTAEITSALHHYQLKKTEDELLENTLKGSIKALVEILSIVNPTIFGQSEIIRDYVVKCAEVLGIPRSWELESTALLSQIGLVTLPESVIEKGAKGGELSIDEQMSYEYYPELSANLINEIPRLESISNALRYQQKSFSASDGGPCGKSLPIESRLLKAILDLVAWETAGLNSIEALKKLYAKRTDYDQDVLTALKKVLDERHEVVIMEIPVEDLESGMVIAVDVITASGALLVGRGQKVCTSLAARINNFRLTGEISATVKIFVTKPIG